MRMTNSGRGHEGYKNRKLFKTSVLKSFLRFLADPNRRTRFCRPLTKPLIQGTSISFFFAASFVSRLRLQRYDYFLNLQAF